MVHIDPATEYGARVERHLRDDLIVWLTTVSADGTPQPSPVWFLWDGDSVLIYSQPDTPKLKNIARQPKVALNFDGNKQGGDIVVITGTAEIVDHPPSALTVEPYVVKYAEDIRRISMDPESFAAAYSVAVRVRPEKMRGH